MRRMYSEKQIKNLIEEDLSGVVLVKGQYTSDVYIKMTRVGHCTTIAGYVIVNNTSETTENITAFTINDAPFSDNVDGDEFPVVKRHSEVDSFATGGIVINDGVLLLTLSSAPTGESTYFLDVDIIDDTPFPVEDYPGE